MKTEALIFFAFMNYYNINVYASDKDEFSKWKKLAQDKTLKTINFDYESMSFKDSEMHILDFDWNSSSFNLYDKFITEYHGIPNYHLTIEEKTRFLYDEVDIMDREELCNKILRNTFKEYLRKLDK